RARRPRRGARGRHGDPPRRRPQQDRGGHQQARGALIMAVIETQGFKLDNSGKRIVVDPITRLEGDPRIEVNVDDKNVIRNAVSTGTMWRGLEVILKGRDP